MGSAKLGTHIAAYHLVYLLYVILKFAPPGTQSAVLARVGAAQDVRGSMKSFYCPLQGEKNGRQGRSAPASVAAARRVSPQTKSGQQGWGLARAKKKKLPESAPPPNEPPAEPRSWRRAPMAPRTRLGKARAAAAAEATCLLLDLSHDEVSIVTHELCDPLQPLLAVHLSTRVAPFDLNSRA